MNTNLEPIGNIGGNKIYADTGQDHIKMLQDEIRRKVLNKKLTPGNKIMMRVAFDGKPVLIEISIKEYPLIP